MRWTGLLIVVLAWTGVALAGAGGGGGATAAPDASAAGAKAGAQAGAPAPPTVPDGQVTGSVAIEDSPFEIVAEAAEGMPTVIVRARRSEVAIPSCRGVGWERYDPDSGSYVAVEATPCGAVQPATWLTTEPTTFRLEKTKSGEIVRAVIVYGTGCTKGQPFTLAGCRTIEAVRGPNITVRKGP